MILSGTLLILSLIVHNFANGSGSTFANNTIDYESESSTNEGMILFDTYVDKFNITNNTKEEKSSENLKGNLSELFPVSFGRENVLETSKIIDEAHVNDVKSATESTTSAKWISTENNIKSTEQQSSTNAGKTVTTPVNYIEFATENTKSTLEDNRESIIKPSEKQSSDNTDKIATTREKDDEYTTENTESTIAITTESKIKSSQGQTPNSFSQSTQNITNMESVIVYTTNANEIMRDLFAENKQDALLKGTTERSTTANNLVQIVYPVDQQPLITTLAIDGNDTIIQKEKSIVNGSTSEAPVTNILKEGSFNGKVAIKTVENSDQEMIPKSGKEKNMLYSDLNKFVTSRPLVILEDKWLQDVVLKSNVSEERDEGIKSAPLQQDFNGLTTMPSDELLTLKANVTPIKESLISTPKQHMKNDEVNNKKQIDIRFAKGTWYPKISRKAGEETNSDNDCVNHTFLPHECSPVHFYRCVNGRKIRMGCPDGFFFDEENSICTWPPNGRCRTILKEGCTYISPYFADRDDPNFFYQCANGKFVRFKCPDDLVFNKEKNVCDWKKDAPQYTSSVADYQNKYAGEEKLNPTTNAPTNGFYFEREGWRPVVGATPQEPKEDKPMRGWEEKARYPTIWRWPQQEETTQKPPEEKWSPGQVVYNQPWNGETLREKWVPLLSARPEARQEVDRKTEVLKEENTKVLLKLNISTGAMEISSDLKDFYVHFTPNDDSSGSKTHLTMSKNLTADGQIELTTGIHNNLDDFDVSIRVGKKSWRGKNT